MWVFTQVNITWNQCVLVLRFSWMETILDSAEAASAGYNYLDTNFLPSTAS